MIEASVGFQCPECVATGRKQMRTGQLRFGGEAAADPRITSWVLIGLNAAVWLAIMSTGGAGSRLIDTLALLPESTIFRSPGGLVHVDGVAGGAWWQLATSAFTHVQLLHIGFNMLALSFLGPPLEQVLGRARFLAVYGLSALAGGVAVLWLSDPNGQTVGASGAIFGLLGALIVVGLKVGGDVRQLWFWLTLNVIFTVTAGAYISWQGHFGGLVGGALTAAAIVYAPKANRDRVQRALLVVILLALLGAAFARVLLLG